ncbi:Acyl dehydratase [Sphingomonas sp. YR710]|jgi:acyl dehydratase|uniref:MaoC family dehydratase n=1 Tax=Sphingomonas sp. YR710 TaxID=1882773 RepID=UPI000888E874|nr:MaoC family dehydratase [Sphingomonas sp. YR710]SDD15101.1 Acyl dehydratase [Sphingomonas sp. YR710]
MAIDPEALLAREPIVTRQTLAERDVMLYALGVGAQDLSFVYEDGLKVLPTMATVLAYPGFVWKDFDLGADWRKVLHGETSVEIHSALPVEGELVGSTTFGPIFDKGADKGTVCYVTREIRDAAGTLVATVRNSSFLRGDGGRGGSSEPQRKPHPLPDRAPDESVTLETTANQAMIYRLSGDYNPLHIDPEVAKAGGFDRPILHGLATYGVAGRAVLAALCGNDPARLKRLDARFASPVFPGETIRTDIWRESEGRASYRSSVVERDLVVLNNGYVEFA